MTVVGASGLVVYTITSKSYGIEGLGLFSQALAIYNILGLVANLGLQTSAQKHASQYAEDWNTLCLIYTAAVACTLAIGFSLMVGGLAAVKYLPELLSDEALVPILTPLAVAMPFFSVNKTINNFMSGLRQMAFYSGIRCARWVLVICLMWVGVSLELPIYSISFSFLITEVLLFIFLLTALRRYLLQINYLWLRVHMIFGVRAMFADLGATISSSGPIVLLGYLVSAGAVGVFAYIESFAKLILTVSSAMQKNFNPIFTRLWHLGEIEQIKKKAAEVLRFQVILLAPLIVATSFLFYVYTSLFMDSDYLNYFDLLLIYFLGTSMMFLFSPFTCFLIMSDNLNWNIGRTLLEACVLIFLTYLCVNYLGIYGAPIAYLISTLINLIVLNGLYHHVLNLDWKALR